MDVLLLLLTVLSIGGKTLALENGLGLTPQMGWNSWNHFHCNINETVVKATADAIVAKGLDKLGYVYVNIDDCWAKSRSSDGTIIPDPVAFPDMAALAQYVHDKGLKFGLYSDAGTETCAGRPGSLGYETNDADTYAKWKVDYLKYDNCHAGKTDVKVRYPVMTKALNESGRHIFFSMCEWGVEQPATWARPVGNSWRTTGDIRDSFLSMVANLETTEPFWKDAGPGGWNDPDMLEVGNGGMTTAEYEAHFSLWCLTKAPLLIGCDLSKMSDDTLRILSNKEVIAVNQDPLGTSGHLVAQNLETKVWAGPLSNGDVAMVLFNLGNSSATITADWKHISLLPNHLMPNQTVTVRDLWKHENLEDKAKGSVSATVPSHGVVMYRLTPIGD